MIGFGPCWRCFIEGSAAELGPHSPLRSHTGRFLRTQKARRYEPAGKIKTWIVRPSDGRCSAAIGSKQGRRTYEPRRMGRLAAKLLLRHLLCRCRPELKQLVSRGVIMSSKGKQGRSASNFDECSIHLLSAFFCLSGTTAEDDRLRKSIENVLTELSKTQSTVKPSNVIQFCRRSPLVH